MSSLGLIFISKLEGSLTIFTTHATLLGRFLCSGNVDIYREITALDPDCEAYKRGIYIQHKLEKACVSFSKIFTTVSNLTAYESERFLNRIPDGILPNGINISNSLSIHDIILKHFKNKERIDRFVKSHFLKYSII
jgi:glycogen synthase